MPSDRQIIESEKSFLRRKYPATADGLAALKTLANQFYDSDPQNVEVTSTAFEGGSGGGQLTQRRELRRIALEELIVERDGTIATVGSRVFFTNFNTAILET